MVALGGSLESRNDVAALGPEGGPPAGSGKGAGQPRAKRGVVAAQRGSVTSRCPLCVIHPAGGPPLLTRKCSCWIFVRFNLFHIFLSGSPKWKKYFVSCILVFDLSRTYSCVPGGVGLGVWLDASPVSDVSGQSSRARDAANPGLCSAPRAAGLREPMRCSRCRTWGRRGCGECAAHGPGSQLLQSIQSR